MMSALTYEFVESEEEPESGDYIIHNPPSGHMSLSRLDCGHIGYFSDENDICQWIKSDMEGNEFWPNVWHVNERGATDLCTIENV